jgi:hypothetical protein
MVISLILWFKMQNSLCFIDRQILGVDLLEE